MAKAPWVVAGAVPPPLRAALRGALAALSDQPRGRAILASGLTSRFAVVTDADYDPLRRMARDAKRAEL